VTAGSVDDVSCSCRGIRICVVFFLIEWNGVRRPGIPIRPRESLFRRGRIRCSPRSHIVLPSRVGRLRFRRGRASGFQQFVEQDEFADALRRGEVVGAACAANTDVSWGEYSAAAAGIFAVDDNAEFAVLSGPAVGSYGVGRSSVFGAFRVVSARSCCVWGVPGDFGNRGRCWGRRSPRDPVEGLG
jgi:hypothetical protein